MRLYIAIWEVFILAMIPETVIENVRSQTNVLDVISAFVHLKKSGNNYFGLCPFQAEKKHLLFQYRKTNKFFIALVVDVEETSLNS